jgi:hypothetical protein
MYKFLCAAIFSLLIFGSITVGCAREGDWHGSIRSRIDTEYERIERGIEHGSLTRHEARRLKDELDGILYKIDRMREDGRLNHREREIINRDLDRLDRDITREKRDDDHRPMERHSPAPY